MKVGNPLDKAVGGVAPTKGVGEGSGSTSRTSGNAAKVSDSSNDSATVKISSAASSLLSSTSAATAEFDGAKVEQVKQAIDNGSYQVNHGAIADKLIANAQEILSKKSR